jgi:hypothetical protein
LQQRQLLARIPKLAESPGAASLPESDTLRYRRKLFLQSGNTRQGSQGVYACLPHGSLRAAPNQGPQFGVFKDCKSLFVHLLKIQASSEDEDPKEQKVLHPQNYLIVIQFRF